MRAPAVDHAPLDVPQLARLASPVELVQAAPCRAAAVLRVLRERDCTLHTVRLHLLRGHVREGLRVPERDVVLVRCGRRMQLIQQLRHALALYVRVLEDGRAAAYVGILLLDLRRASTRDERCKHGLEGKGDEVSIREQVLEEVVCLWELNRFRRRDRGRNSARTVEGPPMLSITIAVHPSCYPASYTASNTRRTCWTAKHEARCNTLPHETHFFPAGGAWLRVASERVNERVSALVRWIGDMARGERATTAPSGV